MASVPDVAKFHQPIDHQALQGSFEVLGTQPPGGVVKQVYVGGTLSPLGTYGSVSGVLEYTTTGGPGGGAVTIELSVEPASEGCARLENGRWRLSLPVALSAATEDGELQAAYEGELTALSGLECLSEPSVRAGMDNVPVASFESSTGMSGVDVTGYDYGRVSLSLDLESAAGTLEVQGADVADCVTNPPEPMRDENGNIVGSAGCRGTDFITLRRGVF